MTANVFTLRVKNEGNALRVNFELVLPKGKQRQSSDKWKRVVVTALAVACLGLVGLLLFQSGLGVNWLIVLLTS